jgi:phosphopentomutase
MKRVFLLVLDGAGAGEAPDAAAFGDKGANTLRSVWQTGRLRIPNLLSLGLGCVPGLSFLGQTASPLAAFGALTERSAGKDTTTGHWELAGLVSGEPMPTFPGGFPDALIAAFSAAVGRGVLCNRPYSGTKVIRDFGERHLATGELIVYTSADSVFQVAAHTDAVPLEELYGICRKARQLLVGKWAVGRVIARPFAGSAPDFYRTADRRDFSLKPSGRTLLDALSEAGLDVIGVGKIGDIFAGCGLTRSYPEHGNPDCLDRTMQLAGEDFSGLCFVNLVDFDTLYGHRNDAVGYAEALDAFDLWLGEFLSRLGEEDALLITADHGCDPGDTSTDHTRERVPLLVYGRGISPGSFGIRESFADAAATVAELLHIDYACPGSSVVDGGFD